MKGTRWAGLGLFVAAGLAIPSEVGSQDAAFQQAFSLYQAGKMAQAKTVLEGAVQEHPSALDFSLLGTIETSQGNLSEAEKHLRSALAIEPGLQGAKLTLATVLEREGKLPAAAESLETLVAANPTNTQALLALARLKNRSGNTEGALALALKAKGAAANDPAVLYAVGALCLQMDLIKDGTENLERAVALDPQPSFLYTLASARVANRDLSAAKTIYEDLLRSQPNDPQLNYALGATYFLGGETGAAKPYFERSIRALPGQVESVYYLGVIAEQDGDKDKAVELLRSVVTRQPDHSRAHLALGQVYRAQGKLEEARQELERAARLSPDSQKAHYQLGLLLTALHQQDEARKELETARKLRSSSDDKVSWRLLSNP